MHVDLVREAREVVSRLCEKVTGGNYGLVRAAEFLDGLTDRLQVRDACEVKIREVQRQHLDPLVRSRLFDRFDNVFGFCLVWRT